MCDSVKKYFGNCVRSLKQEIVNWATFEEFRKRDLTSSKDIRVCIRCVGIIKLVIYLIM